MNMPRRIATTLSLLLVGPLLALGPWALAAPADDDEAEAAPKSTQNLQLAKRYTITSPPAEHLYLEQPALPDLSGYTHEAVLAKIQRQPGARVKVRRMLKEDALKDFTGGRGRLQQWVKRQRGMPQAIFIEGGFMTLDQLARRLPSSQFAETAPGIYLARLPIVVAQGATLHIDKRVKDLRLSEEHGAFLVNDGHLFITDSSVTAWREASNGPATFRDKRSFRPFVLSWGGADIYISRSHFASLGYEASKSYGMSISQYTPDMHKRLQRPRPTGWLLDSTFDDIYYGFYCYEADDVVIKGNTYRNNIVYGIDPHDRSERLIIAENHVYGSKKKHGIIVSREVNNSWIINNRSHNNKLSGIVIDRNSVNNLIAYNEVYRNRSDGITLYESANNLIWGNQIFGNARHGVRLRNSVNIRLYENLIANNQLTGIYGHIKDLSDTDRNIALDPFDTQVSMTVVGGQLSGNGSAPIAIDSPLSVELYRVQMLAPPKSAGLTFAGILKDKQEEILDLMVRRNRAVLIDPVETQAELQN